MPRLDTGSRIMGKGRSAVESPGGTFRASHPQLSLEFRPDSASLSLGMIGGLPLSLPPHFYHLDHDAPPALSGAFSSSPSTNTPVEPRSIAAAESERDERERDDDGRPRAGHELGLGQRG